MRLLGFAIAASAIAISGQAQAATIVIFVNPMTLDKHTEVFDTPGPDRLLMCMQPPGTAGCTELPIRRRR